MLSRVSQVLPRFDFRIECAVCEDMGTTRGHNEDVHLLAPKLALFAVADGMGGHSAGEVAARLAVQAVQQQIASTPAQRAISAYVGKPDLDTRRSALEQLRRAVVVANAAVRVDAEQHQARYGMGTTLDVLWLARDHAFIAHVGDSRTYLCRSTATLQLTQDHVQAEALKADGVLRPNCAGRGFRGLTNAIGLGETVSVDTLYVDIGPGDRLLLCTDGVHGPIRGEAHLAELLRRGTAREAARSLVACAAERGRDNATALVVEIGDCLVRRDSQDRGLAADDLERASGSALLRDLSRPLVLAALAAAVEVELPEGTTVPRVVVGDLVAYIVLDGVVHGPAGRTVGTGALLYAESLAGVWSDSELLSVQQRARLLRVRADDFDEVCRENPVLGIELYRRVAACVARSAS
jgi:serine/threonine protein phosphatase PrpC